MTLKTRCPDDTDNFREKFMITSSPGPLIFIISQVVTFRN